MCVSVCKRERESVCVCVCARARGRAGSPLVCVSVCLARGSLKKYRWLAGGKLQTWSYMVIVRSVQLLVGCCAASRTQFRSHRLAVAADGVRECVCGRLCVQ